MNPAAILAAPEDAGKRLDSFLAASLPELTRSAAARLIEMGQVTVDGKPAAKSCKLAGTETIAVTQIGRASCRERV